jgi:exosortase
MTESITAFKRYWAPVGLFSLLAIAYIPMLKDLIGDWLSDPNYSHGFLIMPISAFLFYRNRHKLLPIQKYSIWGALILFGGLAMLILSSAAAEFFTLRFSFIICLSGLGMFFLGWENFRNNWFIFFLLLFMIPIPGIIYYSATMPMQLFSSKAALKLLQLVDIPAVGSGNIIDLPAYRLEVAEACSGLRSLVTLMALGAIYARLTLSGVWRPVILFIAAIPIAICANVFRIFITGVGAYAISPKMAESFLHEVSGIIVFIAALIMIIILGKLLKWREKSGS